MFYFRAHFINIKVKVLKCSLNSFYIKTQDKRRLTDKKVSMYFVKYIRSTEEEEMKVSELSSVSATS